MKDALRALLFGLLLAPSAALAQWEAVVPGGDTVCSDGSPYRFFVHRGDASKLLMEYEGGGACWNGGSCESDVYNKRITNDLVALQKTGPLPGIYDRANPANPLRDYTHVYVPYCTGDLHWGNAAATYQSASGAPLVIQHKGSVNATSALDWAKANVLAPSQVAVFGCSAGGYGAALWSARVAQAYPGARMVELADSAAGVAPEGFFGTLLASWGVGEAWPSFIPGLALDRVDPVAFSLPSLYSAIAGFYPTHSFSQFNTRADSVQTFFYVLAKGSITPSDATDWAVKMVSNVETISAMNPNFRAYLAPGAEHCVINRPSFYSQTVGGRKLTDWVSTLLLGGDPGQVR